jgi:hypothetical protein
MVYVVYPDLKVVTVHVKESLNVKFRNHAHIKSNSQREANPMQRLSQQTLLLK